MMQYGTQKDIAYILDISDRRVRQLRKEQGILQPDAKTKKYDIQVCVAEYINFKIEAESGSKNLADYEKERAKHEKTKREMLDLKLRKMKGELHEASDIYSIWSDMLVNFRNKLLSMASKLAPQLIGETDPQAIFSRMDKEIRDALEEMSEYEPPDYSEEEVPEEENEIENKESN